MGCSATPSTPSSGATPNWPSRSSIIASRPFFGRSSIFAPLFSKHRILSQVAAHRLAVIKILPPLVVTDEDIDYFVDALTATIKRAQRMPSSLTRFALTAAGVR